MQVILKFIVISTSLLLLFLLIIFEALQFSLVILSSAIQ